MPVLRGVQRRGCSCCLVIMLIVIAIIAITAFLTVRVTHAETTSNDTILVIDHSPSNWDCDGVGTDPERLRMQAARLFINYLGAESGASLHRIGVLHFGGQVQPVAPLTDVRDVNTRRRLLAAVEQVQPIPWTDPAAALQAADNLLSAGGRAGQQTVVLFSDGDPAPEPANATSSQGYRDLLAQSVEQLARNRVTLVVILLQATETSCAERVTAEWLDQWQKWAASTPGGSLYVAHSPVDVPPIYQAVARDVAGAQGGEALVRTVSLPQAAPLVVTAPVTRSLAAMTFTIWKSVPEITVNVTDPTGATIQPGPRVVRSGEPGQDREEVWRISEPVIGVWRITLSGAGQVSVWQDVLALPPPPAATATVTPAPTATSAPAATLPATATATPTATPTRAATATHTVAPMATAAVGPIDAGSGSTPARSVAASVAHGPGPLAGLALTSAVLVAALVGRTISRSRRGLMSGELIPIAGPAQMPWPAPRSLDSRQPLVIGQGGRGEWALSDWQGSLRLAPGHAAAVVLAPVSGEVTVNGVRLRHPVALNDGDVIGCGAYRIRYENLLQ